MVKTYICILLLLISAYTGSTSEKPLLTQKMLEKNIAHFFPYQRNLFKTEQFKINRVDAQFLSKNVSLVSISFYNEYGPTDKILAISNGKKIYAQGKITKELLNPFIDLKYLRSTPFLKWLPHLARLFLPELTHYPVYKDNSGKKLISFAVKGKTFHGEVRFAETDGSFLPIPNVCTLVVLDGNFSVGLTKITVREDNWPEYSETPEAVFPLQFSTPIPRNTPPSAG
ncbi:MAG: hypothetical protein GXO69_00355 [Acidobacteria bacterium]|nr:hypothetical protein [Acidobacteriota bacterium]